MEAKARFGRPAAPHSESRARVLVLFHREGGVNSTPVSAAAQMLLSRGLVPVHLRVAFLERKGLVVPQCFIKTAPEWTVRAHLPWGSLPCTPRPGELFPEDAGAKACS